MPHRAGTVLRFMSISIQPRSIGQRRPAALRATSLPILPALLVLATMLPVGLNIRPGGLLLTSPRIVLLASVPFIVSRMARKFAGEGFRVVPCDALVLAASFWMFLSICVTQGVDRAIIGSSVMILELCGGYFLFRSSLNQPGEAVAVARFLTYVIAADGFLSVLDVLTQRAFIQDIVDSITGYSQVWLFDYRHGVIRAPGMQEHPILLGTVCAFGALLSLALMRGVERVALVGGCLIGLITSDSSAPTAGFVLGCGCLAYHRALAGFRWRWELLIMSGGLGLAALFAVHPAPLSFLIEHTTSNPADGYYRMLIWTLVGPLVLASPLFGLGLESDWAERFGAVNTIDSFWLCSAANFGIPAAILFALVLLTACLRPVRRLGAMNEADLSLGRVLGIIVFLYIFIGFTVHFWGCAWILIGIFAAMRVHLGEISRSQPCGAVAQRARMISPPRLRDGVRGFEDAPPPTQRRDYTSVPRSGMYRIR